MISKSGWRFFAAMVVLLVMPSVVSCGNDKPAQPVKNETVERTSEKNELVTDRVEYQMLKGTKDSEGFTKYSIRIFDDDRKLVWEKSYRLTRDSIGLGMLGNDIVVCRIGVGTGLNYTQYFDRNNRRESPVYTTPLLVGYGKVVAPKKGKLIVADMFEHKVFYKELIIEDFPPVANPVDAFSEIKWVGENKLSVTYLIGNRGEKLGKKTVEFDLNE